jgi:uncharacterized protein YgbK (DUF1537 family)
MIAVIADDFTGAAEIGGIGLRYGLNVIIETEIIQKADADLLIIATDTRSLDADNAAIVVKRITSQLVDLNPEFIYKKIDSVLRGNIAVELYAQIVASSKKRAVIIAANPALKRLIRDGIYYVNNVPLHQTDFSFDPEFPVYTSKVNEIIGKSRLKVYSNLKPKDDIPTDGLIVGDVTSVNDLDKWVSKIDENTLPAGASGFFDAIMVQKKNIAKRCNNIDEPFGEKVLCVLGSYYPKGAAFYQKLKSNGIYISNMPKDIYYNDKHANSAIDDWAKEVANALNDWNRVVISINHTASFEQGLSRRIRQSLGELVRNVSNRVQLNELIIEGGSTTSEILHHLAIKKLIPFQELETGVIRMKSENMPQLHIITKPGSYTWPENIWFHQQLGLIT